jgi:hypothetical protein
MEVVEDAKDDRTTLVAGDYVKLLSEKKCEKAGLGSDFAFLAAKIVMIIEVGQELVKVGYGVPGSGELVFADLPSKPFRGCVDGFVSGCDAPSTIDPKASGAEKAEDAESEEMERDTATDGDEEERQPQLR